MSAEAICNDEASRLRALRDLDILDTAPDPRFDRIVRLAKAACGAPIALISLVDEHRQWFKAADGLEAGETPREEAFCAHALSAPTTMWVEDARQDQRFADNRFVTGEPFVRFYAGAPIKLSSGYLVGTVCIIDDVPRPYDRRTDDILSALASLAADEMEALAAGATVNAFIDNAPAPILMTDRDLRITRVSQAWCDLYRLQGHDVTGKLLTEVFTHAAEWSQVYAKALEGEVGRGVAESRHDAVGAGHWFKWTVAPWRDAVGRIAGLLIATLDVTDLVRAQREVEEARQVAERASEAKSQFLANMSHEIRTPMNGVLGIVSALARTPLTADQAAMVSLVERSGQALNTLLSDLLDVSRMEAGQLSLAPEPFDLALMLADLGDLFAPFALEKALALNVERLPQPLWLLGDSLRLRQILSNLVTNALKFTDAGSVTLSVEGPDEDGRISLAVHDTGVGFAQSAADALFDRFHQLDATATRRHGGVGLGLAISRSLAQLMGGDLTVTSAPGVGSTFRLAVVMPASEPVTAGEGAATTDALGLRVLLAEDNPVNQQVVRLILDQIGVDLTIVENGQQAVEAFKGEPFDLILMDMQMPVMDGLTAVRAIRTFERETARPSTPIKTLSANALAEHRQAALEAGADDHLSKPITAATLIKAVSAEY